MSNDIKEFHWIMDMIQNIDVGLVIMDTDFKVQAWNGFMENHSGIEAYSAKEKNFFDLFPDVDKPWFEEKVNTVMYLKNRAFTTWEQRPYLVKFKNYRPITGTAEFMYQNTTILPLESANGKVEFVSLLIYDVTDVAVNRQELKAVNAKLEKLSRTDRLTGLNNRGYWEEQLQNEFKRFQRTGNTVSLIMFDIDHFKQVNDTYGHQAGDEVLRNISNVISKTARATDIIGRYGGEEFGLILINTNPEQAFTFAERLRQAAEEQSVSHEGQSIEYRISLGVSACSDQFDTYEQWLEASDKALYESKHNGRNQTTIYKG